MNEDLLGLPEDVRATAHVFNNGEIAWPNENALSAINALANAGKRILGLDAQTLYPDGGVMEIPISVWSERAGNRERDEQVGA